MARVHHYPEDLVAEDEPFAERFRAVLDKAQRLYLDEGKDFCLTLEGNGSSTLQVISSAVLENADSSARGFGIHLPLDDSFPGHREAAERVWGLASGKEFTYLDLDGLPTFQADFGLDVDRLEALVRAVPTEVFLEDVDDFGLFEV